MMNLRTFTICTDRIDAVSLVRQVRGVSGREARTLLAQRGVRLITGPAATIVDADASLCLPELDGAIIRIGRRWWRKISARADPAAMHVTAIELDTDPSPADEEKAIACLLATSRGDAETRRKA